MRNERGRGIYLDRIKRMLDVLLSLILLVLLSPMLLLISAAVRLFLGSPVIFRQERGGLGGKPFVILKFRTMSDAKDEKGALLSDRERLTRFGAFLRRTSLDELPQLVNILRGDMSFVGPRPQLADFLPYYTEDEMKRHRVRPGLTGLAQVSGRGDLAWKKRFELDVLYTEKASFALDLRIMLMTLAALFRTTGESDAEDFYKRH